MCQLHTLMYNSCVKSLTISIFLVPIVVFLVSCSNDVEESALSAPMINKSVESVSFSKEIAMDSAASSQENSTYIGSDRKVQVNGRISFEVENISDFIDQTMELVSKNNGRVTNSDTGESDRKYANITILVPKDSFDSLLKELKTIASKVLYENISALDVSEEFIDVGAKLNVMKQTESRLISLLSETKNVEEVITVERELMRLRGQIDSLEGRLRYLTNTTENSILHVNMTEQIALSSNDWNIGDSFKNSVRSLISFSKYVADFLINVLIFSPIIIIIISLIIFAVKMRKKIFK